MAACELEAMTEGLPWSKQGNVGKESFRAWAEQRLDGEIEPHLRRAYFEEFREAVLKEARDAAVVIEKHRRLSEARGHHLDPIREAREAIEASLAALGKAAEE